MTINKDTAIEWVVSLFLALLFSFGIYSCVACYANGKSEAQKYFNHKKIITDDRGCKWIIYWSDERGKTGWHIYRINE